MSFIQHSYSRNGFERAVSIIIPIAFLASMTMAALAPQFAHAANIVSTAELVRLANTDRSTAGLGTLKINQRLVAAAQAKANDMAQKGYFAHEGPDGNSSWHWFELVGYQYASAGENLAVNYASADAVERAWMNSPEHRTNLMSGKYTEVGIATAVGTYKGRQAVFVAQMFGRPLSTALASAPSAPFVSSALLARNDNAEIRRLQAIVASLQAQLKALNRA